MLLFICSYVEHTLQFYLDTTCTQLITTSIQAFVSYNHIFRSNQIEINNSFCYPNATIWFTNLCLLSCFGISLIQSVTHIKKVVRTVIYTFIDFCFLKRVCNTCMWSHLKCNSIQSLCLKVITEYGIPLFYSKQISPQAFFILSDQYKCSVFSYMKVFYHLTYLVHIPLSPTVALTLLKS